MIDDDSDIGFALELLAAYVDGELDRTTRECVERWLAERPEALSELLDQERLSPANEDYWQRVSPPAPSVEKWDGLLSEIEFAVKSRNRRPAGGRYRYPRPSVAIAGIAAALMVALFLVPRQRPGTDPVGFDPKFAVLPNNDDEEFVFRLATQDDVELIQFSEAAADLLVVGKHPLQDTQVMFAKSDDFQVLNYGMDDQGEVPDYQAMIGAETPMFIPPPRKK